MFVGSSRSYLMLLYVMNKPNNIQTEAHAMLYKYRSGVLCSPAHAIADGK